MKTKLFTITLFSLLFTSCNIFTKYFWFKGLAQTVNSTYWPEQITFDEHYNKIKDYIVTSDYYNDFDKRYYGLDFNDSILTFLIKKNSQCRKKSIGWALPHIKALLDEGFEVRDHDIEIALSLKDQEVLKLLNIDPDFFELDEQIRQMQGEQD
jgi:hypothetical protein